MSIKKFKEENPFERRIESSRMLLEKYHDRIPIICGVRETDLKLFENYNKIKYLVPCELTIGQFLHIIRKKINLNKSQALFIFTEKNTLCNMVQNVSSIFNEYKSEDGFLYLTIAKESTFGK